MGKPAIASEPFYNCGNVSMLSCIGLAGVVLQHYVRGGFDADLFQNETTAMETTDFLPESRLKPCWLLHLQGLARLSRGRRDMAKCV